MPWIGSNPAQKACDGVKIAFEALYENNRHEAVLVGKKADGLFGVDT